MLRIKRIATWILMALALFALSAGPAAATTKTVSYKASYYSLVGICVATHTGVTYWTYSGGKILTGSAHGAWNNYWTAPLNYVSGVSSTWNWFNSSNGQSNNKIVLTFGVPTPWGPIGAQRTSRWITTVYGSGGSSASHT